MKCFNRFGRIQSKKNNFPLRHPPYNKYEGCKVENYLDLAKFSQNAKNTS